MEPLPMVMAELGDEILAVLKTQKQAFTENPFPSISERRSDLRKLLNLLAAEQNAIVDAINSDFGQRSRIETMTAEVMQVQHKIEYILKNLRRWMAPQRRSTGLLYLPARAAVHRQPLGVIGVISPWNYPLELSLTPIAYALAAGNRVMLKPSEHTPQTSALIARLLKARFPQDKVAVIEGGIETSIAFSQLPFDHLLFTGSTAVGHQVMAAASSNLTPVTLELGGKSPCIIGREARLKEAVSRICFGKSINAGQTCIAPDYILLPQGMEEEFIREYKLAWQRMYPDGEASKDLTSVINSAQFDRLNRWLDEAREGGARIEVVNHTGAWEREEGNMMPTHLLLGVDGDCSLMNEEIFGPLLPIITYGDFDEVIAKVNSGERPLALYYFGDNRKARKKILQATHSGGLVFNDTSIQFTIRSLPFGGVGHSGMGSYHGREGFTRFTHERAVVRKGRLNPLRLAYPPSGRRFHRLIEWLFIRR